MLALAALWMQQHGAAVHVLAIILLTSASASFTGGIRSGRKFKAPASVGKVLEEPAELRPRGSKLLFLQVSQPPQNRQTVPQARQTPQATGTDQDSEDFSPTHSFSVVASSADQRAPGGTKPVKSLLFNLAAINQKLAEDEMSAGDVPQMLDDPSASGSAAEESESALQSSGLPLRQTSEAPEPPVDRTLVAEAAPAHHEASTAKRAAGHGRPALAAFVRAADRSANHHTSNHGQPGAAIGRPQAVAGQPDEVRFGLFGKTFYGVDLKEQEYTIDSILTLQWMDVRAISLVPTGQEELTLSSEDAEAQIWMPNVEITNRVARRYDRISSSVTVLKDGTVTKVERTLAVIKNKFVLNDYPFDRQVLRLHIASTQYMLNEVKLAPSDNYRFSGLRQGFFEGEDYIEKGFNVQAYEDIDGSLKKSRGSMEISVARSLSRFHRNFLVPAIIYLSISCAVFWLPFSPTFVTPRLALSIFILLIFSNLAATVDGELPSGAPYNWGDLMCFVIQLHMFTVVCLNIFTEIAYHSLKCTVTAVHLTNELKVVAPMAASLSMAAILAASTKLNGSFDLQVMRILMPASFLLLFITYMTCCGSSLSAELVRNKRADTMKSQEYGGGNMGPLTSSESLPPATQ